MAGTKNPAVLVDLYVTSRLGWVHAQLRQITLTLGGLFVAVCVHFFHSERMTLRY